MYALNSLSLTEQFPSDVIQVWYADDTCACGSIVQLHQWWEHLVGLDRAMDILEMQKTPGC